MNINLTLIGQIGTFLVLWWFVHKHIWPVFSRVAEERRQKIAEGLSMADQARFKMAAAKEETAQLVEDAKNQAQEIINRAQKQADSLISQAKEEASLAGKRELEAARAEIEQEKSRVRDELRQHVAALVIQGAAQVIGREVNSSDHERLLRELSEKL